MRRGDTEYEFVSGLLNPYSKVITVASLAVAMLQGRWGDIVTDWNNGCFNPFNMNERIAYGAKVFSFYKGEVVRHSSQFSSFQILGTIFLHTSHSTAIDLNHEFGHSIQERFMGPTYLFTVAIPSMIACASGLNGAQYYSLPWERTADFFWRGESGIL